MLLTSYILQGQDLRYFSTFYSDSFKKWQTEYVVDPFQEEIEIDEGRFGITWELNDDWTEWNYESGDLRGSVYIKGHQSSPYFELINQDQESLISRVVWPRDYSKWKISNDSTYFELEQKFSFDNEEWVLTDDKRKPVCTFITITEGDKREWAVEFHTDEVIEFEIQQLCSLIIIYVVCPKI